MYISDMLKSLFWDSWLHLCCSKLACLLHLCTHCELPASCKCICGLLLQQSHRTALDGVHSAAVILPQLNSSAHEVLTAESTLKTGEPCCVCASMLTTTASLALSVLLLITIGSLQ
jgi:hypothetical protein